MKIINKRQMSIDPGVFILESNTLANERSGDAEGELISRILRLSRVKSQYFYFRTKRELRELLGREFYSSRLRYLHIAAHGNENGMATTFDDLSFPELAELLEPTVSHRRIFFSACSMTNHTLAHQVFSKTECLSIMGPANNIFFGDAAVFWASFYTVMLRDYLTMSYSRIVMNARALARAFRIDLNFFGRSRQSSRPYTFTKIREAESQQPPEPDK